MRWILLLALLLSGCAMIGASALSPEDVAEATQIIEAAGGSGCAWLRGSGNPPAAEIDLDFIYSWGGVPYPECVKTLRER